MAIPDQATLEAAVTKLVQTLRTGNGALQRSTPAWTVREQAVLTADLHEIAAAAQRHLEMAAQMEHPLYQWSVAYQPDGAAFFAYAPS